MRIPENGVKKLRKDKGARKVSFEPPRDLETTTTSRENRMGTWPLFTQISLSMTLSLNQLFRVFLEAQELKEQFCITETFTTSGRLRDSEAKHS